METKDDLRFGALAVKNGFSSESDVEFALETQRESSGEGAAPKLGEILTDMGSLTPEKVNALLVEQQVLRSGVDDTAAPAPDAPAANPSPGDAAPPAGPPAEASAKGGAFKRMMAAIGDKLRRLFRDVSGKRAKEKALASEKRDELLSRIAEAALGAGASGPEADSARKAREGSEAARKKAEGGAGTGAVAAKSAVKAAESKHKRALIKLGRTAIEKGQVPADQQAAADEVRALDAKISDLG